MSLTESLPTPELSCYQRQIEIPSVEKFLARLSVSVKAMNRWEQRHSVPSLMTLRFIEAGLSSIDELGKTLAQQCFPKGKRDD